MKDLTLTQEENFYLEVLILEMGMPVTTQVDERIIHKYNGILPDLLLKYWNHYGFCNFNNGLIWLTNPEDYEGVLEAWLPAEVLAEKPHFVIARTGWGELLVWEPSYGFKYTINPIHGYIFAEEGDRKQIEKGEADQVLGNLLAYQDVEYRKRIRDGESYFDYAVEKFGALKENEMFTFVPAVFMGGKIQKNNIRKVDLFIQMDILAQMANPQIIGLKELRKMAFGR